jgi:hypothetical protein
MDCHARSASRPKIEVADIFRRYHDSIGPLPSHSAKVVRNIVNCRTEKLGGHARHCNDCDYQEHSYNSCRDRHCPKCQFLTRQRWVESRVRDLLPIEYFHVVFTIPHVFNNLALQNKAVFYNILFRTAADTLKKVAKRKLDAEIGFVAVLHTWGQNLMQHPHLHMIVTGGGIRNNKTWISCKKGYLAPLNILSTVFRGKFLSTLENAYSELTFYGALSDLDQKEQFKKLLIEASQRSWRPYAKRPFAGPKQILAYLGQYTHRIAISNHRLLKLEDDHISFKYRDYADNNKDKVMSLHVQEFMRRFLLHILPRRFVRIRHYGLLGNRLRKEQLSACKKTLCPGESLIPPSEKKDWRELLKELTGVDINLCPLCGGRMIEFIIAPKPTAFLDSS